MIKQEYIVVHGDSFVALQRIVIDYLENGWVLVGGVAGNWVQGFMQAMYRETEVDEEAA